MTTTKTPLSSSEIGTLWVTYQEKTLIMRILEYFSAKSDDFEAKQIMDGLWSDLNQYVQKITAIFQSEGVAVPIGFTTKDVNLNAPKLYDNGFDIMFVRILKELSMGMYTLNMQMAYREDVICIYKELTAITQQCYLECTKYLRKRGILVSPPNVTMPTQVEFIQNNSYLNGFRLFGEKRAMNLIELGYMHHGIETNNIGMQLITGFAQCAKNKDVKDYFVKGIELSKKIIRQFQEMLLQDDIQFSATSGCTVTTSQVAPFSEKLMMYTIHLLNTFGLGSNSFAMSFSLRRDIIMQTSSLTKDAFTYAQDGVRLLIENGWMEEPPQVENRKELIHK
ncbi:DUF3231 family protein [Brevibacillus fluminis]|uniref:DUF3231 family protein n=1 Tax=Brevibacillus fluminis TaxID=511487 RepID=UPI003F8B04C2